MNRQLPHDAVITLNLGLGPASLTMLCLLIESKLMVDGQQIGPEDVHAVVFASTGAEHRETKAQLQRVRDLCWDAGLRFIMLRKQNGRPVNGRASIEERASSGYYHRLPSMPDAEALPDRFFCCAQHKFHPIARMGQDLAIEHFGHKAPHISLVGLTANETERTDQFSDAEYRFPLIEAKISTTDCNEILHRHGFDKVRQASCFCCRFPVGLKAKKSRRSLKRARRDQKLSIYKVAALYVDARGPYSEMCADAYDAKRDARTYSGDLPVVCHPPCGPWGKLKGFCKHQDAATGIHAIEMVRKNGGILEHPVGSSLFSEMGIHIGDWNNPHRKLDAYGGYTLKLAQRDYGHRADKETILYIVGAVDLPTLLKRLDDNDRAKAQNMSRLERRLTPPEFAEWLCSGAEKCMSGDDWRKQLWGTAEPQFDRNEEMIDVYRPLSRLRKTDQIDPLEMAWLYEADAAIGTTCPFCDDDWDFSSHAHWMFDAQIDQEGGQCFLTFHPCCQSMKEFVETHGYEEATGRTIKDVVREFTLFDVLEVIDHGDGTIVCRLAVYSPTKPTDKTDRHGHLSAKSTPGFQTEVFDKVHLHHRHHDAPVGWKFGVAIYNGPVQIGVATVGRPVSREIQAQQPHTLEVTRVCTWGHSALRKNASSKLYSAAAKQARALRYDRIITYTLFGEEDGHSLVASGWTPTAITDAKSWDCPSRPRETTAPTGRKVRWEKGLIKKTRKLIAAGAIELPAG